MASTQTADGMAAPPAVPPTRPEYVRDVVAGSNIGVVQKPLTTWERLTNQNWVRKIFILVAIASAAVIQWFLSSREATLLAEERHHEQELTPEGLPGHHQPKKHHPKKRR